MKSEEFEGCSKNSEIKSDKMEPPFKKGRYVWQLNSKLHSDSNNILKASYVAESTTNHKQVAPKREDNPCNRNCYIEALLSQSDMLFTSSDSSDDEDGQNQNFNNVSHEIPVTLVESNLENEDYYLNKWHEKQLAKAYMDNTINTILETFKIAPIDMDDFVENCENDEQVEDEGILMAIQSHGLQPNVNNWGECSTNQGKSKNCFEHTQISSQNNVDDDGNVEVRDHSNFMDAAVSVAIQKKGLLSQNYD